MEINYNALASAIDSYLTECVGHKIGFCLLVFPFEENDPSFKNRIDKGANYISNANREDMIKALRETADRLEKNEIIGKPDGNA